MHFIMNGKKNEKKCQLQTEYHKAVNVTAPGSSSRPPVSLEYQRLSGWHFPCKIIVELQKNRISCACKFCIPDERKDIHWVMLQRNLSDMGMRAIMNVPSVWWHYILTLALDFIISTRIQIVNINLERGKIITTDCVAIYMHGVK